MTRAWLDELAAATADIADIARRSLVGVIQKDRNIGSGIVWGQGLIVTNAHVARSKRLGIRSGDGTMHTAWVRAIDRRLDLAVLEVNGEIGPAAAPGDSSALRTGEWVFAVGHPWGVAGGVTGGVVIDPAAGRDGSWLALGLHLRPGHSGGAVVNVRGEVVGVNTMMNGPDVGVAIASAAVKRFLAEAGWTRSQTPFGKAA